MKKITGFTLIELVIVIVILGILSVLALPKFIDFQSETRLAVFKSSLGSFKSAISTSHLKWLALGSPTGAEAKGLIGAIDFNDLGYPAGPDLIVQVDSAQDCLAIYQGIMDTDMVLKVPSNDGAGIKNLASDVDIAVTSNSHKCYYTFVSESKDVGFNARQFRYHYLTGEVIEWPAGYTLP